MRRGGGDGGKTMASADQRKHRGQRMKGQKEKAGGRSEAKRTTRGTEDRAGRSRKRRRVAGARRRGRHLCRARLPPRPGTCVVDTAAQRLPLLQQKQRNRAGG